MDYKQEYDYLFKIVLVGDTGVGKTSLLSRYTDGKFSDSYVSTIGVDFRTKTIGLDGKNMKLQIWDLAGSERFINVTRVYYRGASGVILLYDIANQNSFDNLKFWIQEIQEKAEDEVNIILVGTKSDLVSKRVIDTETGKVFFYIQ
ncbi:small rab-related gtpase [Anaeramoeba ignava]|uniref:Small rab-related gtpase n=1 Tax=Anaeramoeba ignava TaxID=1746090 RepID=A0A9Q0LDK8_ANAIG|nr:small rab-related gtpase [Anaeramoeba ignava]